MNALTSKNIGSMYGEKSISVHCQDICDLTQPLDIMTISAFYGNYEPTPNTLLHALDSHGIPVEKLAGSPAVDLRRTNRIWLSEEIDHSDLPISRIGCIEMSPYRQDRGLWREHETDILSSIKAYFHMLRIAALSGMKTETVGLPILGGGSQQIDTGLITIPTLNECIQTLKSSESIREIRIISRNQRQAFQFAMTLENSYSALQEAGDREQRKSGARDKYVFISYSTKDRNIDDNLCAKLESRGIRVWYAPRNISSVSGRDYASSIVNAITECTHFVVIISRNSLQSEHVLNEIDLAFQEIRRNMHIVPLRIDEEEMGEAFRYYLSRQHWMDAHVPPLEKRLEEFADSFLTQ